VFGFGAATRVYPSVNHAVGLALTFTYLNQLPLKLRMHGLRQPQSGRIRHGRCAAEIHFGNPGAVRDYECEQDCSDRWRLGFYIFFQHRRRRRDACMMPRLDVESHKSGTELT
jgi:hypothetical protein